MSSHNFSVGSVVYFLHSKSERVLPAQVVEKIVRTSLDGSKSTYIIAVQSSEGRIKKIEVDPDAVDIFPTPKQMKEFMVSRATAAVTKLVDNAVNASSVFEPVVTPPREKEPIEDMILSDPDEAWHTPAAERPIKNSKSKKSEYAEVDLGDGTTARMKV
tara:strand:+ start:58 stop:534 length:477 start_codon:yes stop_codon:yes gene_type:complete